jgi:hypothetical protein
MEVETLEDGSKAFVTNYDGNLKDEFFKREQATYQFLKQSAGSETVTPHSFDEDGEWSASKEFDGKLVGDLTDEEKSNRDYNKGELVDLLAHNLIAGNNDLHAENVMMDEDGNLGVIDLDHSAGRLDEVIPAGTVRNVAQDRYQSTINALDISAPGNDNVFDEVLERAEELAFKYNGPDSMGGLNFDLPDTEYGENVEYNIEMLDPSVPDVNYDP